MYALTGTYIIKEKYQMKAALFGSQVVGRTIFFFSYACDCRS